MKSNRFWILLCPAMAWVLLFLNPVAVAAEHEHAMKVGKKGGVHFAAETKVGDLTLKPGRYTMQHRVDGPDHFIHLTELRGGKPAGEVKCRLEPLKAKVSRTTMYAQKEDGTYRLTRVEVAGENVAHLF
ncbi:MAG: hypothetical protein HY238_23150 [Acidobacteria bacterium]|nr:hypothetical protein [Acidobacteriota bacterium]